VKSIKSGRDAAGGRAYNMSLPVRSKKMAPFRRHDSHPRQQTNMVRTCLMTNRIFAPHRRQFIAGVGTATLTAIASRVFAAQAPQALRLEAKPATILLRQGQAPTPIWELDGLSAPLRLKRGQLEVTFRNDLPVPASLDWRGMDGIAATEPLASRPVASGTEVTFQLPLRRPGTFFGELRLPADAQRLPSRAFPLIVEEDSSISSDRDQVLLIEQWQISPNGTALATGSDIAGGQPIYTLNGQAFPKISVRSGERLRLRFINGCQRQVIAARIEGPEVRVIAIDSAPAEPFAARNGALVLAPGGRVDALIDVSVPPGGTAELQLHDGKEAHPLARLAASKESPIRAAPLPPAAALPADGLPARLDLKGAMRVDLALQGSDWSLPEKSSATAAPTFKAKTGRTIVLALSNRAELATTFHLHGHHFRLLDRLDDGWKPFWLDTLVLEPGQTQRVAFAAEFPGRWLIESTATSWAAPRLGRWYSVE
jgi:FtsP/CotA-like multicopper oxidase with cupredoxin domain